MREGCRGPGVVFAAALLGVFAIAGIAHARTQILWSSVDNDFARQRLVIAQPDGSNLRDLTDPKPAHTLDSDVFEYRPAWGIAP